MYVVNWRMMFVADHLGTRQGPAGGLRYVIISAQKKTAAKEKEKKKRKLASD
jgi:hypothetical protein